MSFEPLGEHLDDTEDYDGTYLVGTVIDNKDPDGLERVKAIIPGVYPTAADCVWIGPFKKSPFGQGKGFGSFGVPAKGSRLLVELQHEDPHHPVYHGCILMMGDKTGALKEEFHEEAWGFSDPSGNKLVVDMRTQTLTFIHSTKVVIKIEEGTMTIQTPKDFNVISAGNVNMSVKGNLSAVVSGESTIHSDGVTHVQGSQIYLNGG